MTLVWVFGGSSKCEKKNEGTKKIWWNLKPLLVNCDITYMSARISHVIVDQITHEFLRDCSK